MYDVLDEFIFIVPVPVPKSNIIACLPLST